LIQDNHSNPPMEKPMTNDSWNTVDDYFTDLFIPPDPVLDDALKATAEADMPAINVTPTQGKLLHLLARAINARSILEIGTLGGYSAIWLARALPPGGRLITLEVNPAHAAVAQANIERAGLETAVDIRIGPALTTLPQLGDEDLDPFDLVFIDADKVNTTNYFNWALRLTRPGSLIIIDNVVRGGEVADPTSIDPNAQGIRQALAVLADQTGLVTTALQTVGGKGYDGLAIALVVSEQLAAESWQ
jgi:predicted O-methyltransferase YrrM